MEKNTKKQISGARSGLSMNRYYAKSVIHEYFDNLSKIGHSTVGWHHNLPINDGKFNAPRKVLALSLDLFLPWVQNPAIGSAVATLLFCLSGQHIAAVTSTMVVAALLRQKYLSVSNKRGL